MLTGVQWTNADSVTLPLHKSTIQGVEYTRGIQSEIMMLDNNFISDSKLAIHGSTGAQLLPITDESYTGNGVTLTRNGNGSYTCSGEVIKMYTPVVTFNTFGLTPGEYFVSGRDSSNVLALQMRIVKNGVTQYKSGLITIDGTETSIHAIIQCNRVDSIDSETVDFIINRGIRALPIEPYTGGTPYTDKYVSTIKDQNENSVTLSIENVAESVGDRTELDIVLTDKNGITKRSEVGKTFIGG